MGDCLFPDRFILGPLNLIHTPFAILPFNGQRGPFRLEYAVQEQLTAGQFGQEFPNAVGLFPGLVGNVLILPERTDGARIGYRRFRQIDVKPANFIR